jgi:hypothetical protein
MVARTDCYPGYRCQFANPPSYFPRLLNSRLTVEHIEKIARNADQIIVRTFLYYPAEPMFPVMKVRGDQYLHSGGSKQDILIAERRQNIRSGSPRSRQGRAMLSNPVSSWRPGADGEALPAGTRLSLFSDDKPDRFFTLIKFLMDKTSGVALALKTGVPS